jgi:cholestenol delta-isomerase
LISTGQLYGDIAYYLTAAWENYKHSHPHPFYFWFYFVFMNAFWIVIPIAIMWSSGSEILKGLSKLDERPAKKAKKTK